MRTRFFKVAGTALVTVLAFLGLSAAASAQPPAPQPSTKVVRPDPQVVKPALQAVRPNLAQLSPLGESVFHSVTPTRILDTRNGTGGRSTPLTPGSSFDLQVTGGVVPAGASSVMINIITVNATPANFLTLYATGTTRPNVATINFVAGGPSNNLATVPLSSAGKLTIFDSASTVNVVVDVEGYFAPSVAAGPAGYQAWAVVDDATVYDQWTNNGGTITSSGSGGTTDVDFPAPGIGAFLIANASIQVTPFGVGGDSCGVVAGNPSDGTLGVAVYCVDGSGAPVDTTLFIRVVG